MSEEIIKQYVSETNVPEEFLRSILEKNESVINTVGDTAVERILNSAVKQYTSTDAESMTGIVFTVSNPNNRSEKRISECIKKYYENPDTAIQNGYVAIYDDAKSEVTRINDLGDIITKKISQLPESGVQIQSDDDYDLRYLIPLDNRKIFNSGKSNFNYLNPIKLNDYGYVISGLFVEDDIFKKFEMWFNTDNPITAAKIPVGVPVTFMGVKAGEKEGVIQIRERKITEFIQTEGEINLDTVSTFRPLLKDSIKDVHVDRGVKVAVVGFVQSLWKPDPTIPQWGNITIDNIYNGDEIRVQCHPFTRFNFAINDTIVMFGVTSKGKKYDRETKTKTDEDDYSMFVDGIYCENSSVPDDVEDISDDDLGFGEGESW